VYAVIRTGGKQEKVEEGQTVHVELLGDDAGDEVTFQPVLLVDGDTVLASAEDLRGTTVTARVKGEVKGPKITGFTYKKKTNNRRRWGHRQRMHAIEITAISRGEG
jgi:large subunit ribosomal protein L21